MSKKTYVIAEAGVNHNGDLDTALRMIDAAKETGADCVKFQTFKADSLVTKNAQKAEYQKKTTGNDEGQQQMLRKLELSYDAYATLFARAKSIDIDFLSSPFDVESAQLLAKLGLRTFKVPSGEITNYPLLRFLSKQNATRLILSTGMSTLGDIEAALAVLTSNGIGRERITVLHCNTEYPTPMEDVNLLAMNTIRDAFGVDVGYSDHTDGTEISIAAVALGASLIEKHFTLDRNMPGPDHKASLEIPEFTQMMVSIRGIEHARGSTVKQPSASELKNRPIARKSIVAARTIHMGEELSEENLTTKRPGTGLSPMLWDSVVGRKAVRDFEPDDFIEL